MDASRSVLSPCFSSPNIRKLKWLYIAVKRKSERESTPSFRQNNRVKVLFRGVPHDIPWRSKLCWFSIKLKFSNYSTYLSHLSWLTKNSTVVLPPTDIRCRRSHTGFQSPPSQKKTTKRKKFSHSLQLYSFKMERTYIMVKPDGVQRGLVGEIIKRFEQKGYKLVALELMNPSKEHLEEHYGDLKGKPFFPGMIKYMQSGPVVGMVWAGKAVVSTGRKMLGETNPLGSAPGTIRGDFCLDLGRNICHGSDTPENAEKEIALWFPRGVSSSEKHYEKTVHDLVYE